jgi:hypothetical protein
MAMEKIDLVLQKVRIPATTDSEHRYFLRFWRLAEGEVTLQEIPMNREELASLTLGACQHLTPSISSRLKPAAEDAETDYDDSPDAPVVGETHFKVLVSKKRGGYEGVMRYKDAILRTGKLLSMA